MQTWSHSNIVISNNFDVIQLNKILLEHFDFETRNNPDFYIFEGDIFGIDNVRDFIDWSYIKPFVSNKKVSFIKIQSITTEAQNALLKILEEPKNDNYVFINLPSESEIIKTLISRVRVVYFDDESVQNKSKFFELDKMQKIEYIRKKMKFEKSRKATNSFIDDLILNFSKEIPESHNREAILNSSKKSKILLKAKYFINKGGSSNSMILDWVSTVL